VADELGLRLVRPLVLSPFPARQYEAGMAGVERTICVENNATGQLLNLVRLHGFDVDEAVRRYDGRSFSVEELRTGVEEVLARPPSTRMPSTPGARGAATSASSAPSRRRSRRWKRNTTGPASASCSSRASGVTRRSSTISM